MENLDLDDNKSTYDNYIKSLKYFSIQNVKESLIYLNNENPFDEADFYKLCMGDFYYDEYVNQFVTISIKAIELGVQAFTKDNLDKNDKEQLDFYIKQLKNKIKGFNVKPQKTFKGLFESDEHYEKAVSKLVEYKFITQNENSLNWVYSIIGKGLTENRIFAGLIIVLGKKGYLNKNPISPFACINEGFNKNIDGGNFSTYLSEIEKEYNMSEKIDNNKRYISLFIDIL